MLHMKELLDWQIGQDSMKAIRKHLNSVFEKLTQHLVTSFHLIIATGVRPEDCERKRAKLRAVISCCVFNIC